ncbi:cell death-inducing p53 target 1 [Lobulomyces angularis]|nr:cell death-inducing p53 target 1 [Lobulomyces angularis]
MSSNQQPTPSNSNVNGRRDNLPPSYNETAPLIQPQTIYTVETNAPLHYIQEEGYISLPFRGPVRMFCPYDNKEVVTVVGRKPGLLTYCSSAFLCFVCFPLFWIPFCVDSCNDEIHFCPSCKRALAIAHPSL